MILKNDQKVCAGIGAFVAIALFCLFYFFFSGQEVLEKKKHTFGPAQPFQLAKVKRVSIPVMYRAVGVITSEHKAVVSAQISGVVLSFDVELGDLVPQGIQVVRIKAEELEARHARAVSRLADAEAQKKLAETHFERTKALYKQEAATLEQFEQAEQRLSHATALAASAQEMLREEEVNLGYTKVGMPFKGIVAERFVDPGDFVLPGRQLFSIYDPAAGRIEVVVPERYVGKLYVGLESKVEVKALEKVIKAQVAEIRPHVDPKTRAFVVKCDLLEQEKLLYPGMFGTFVFQIEEREAILISADAVLTIGKLNFVWVRAADQWQKRYVTLGRRDSEGRIEILSGLSLGEQVAVMKKAQSG